MNDPKTPAPHPTAASDHPTPAPKKAAHAPAPKAPRPAPRAPIPSVTIKPEPEQSKGKIAGAVAATVGALGLIGYGIAGVAGRMLRRGR